MIRLRNNPELIARWLRRCSENPAKAGRCNKCPYGEFESVSEDTTCMDALHEAAAELIEQQNHIRKQV